MNVLAKIDQIHNKTSLKKLRESINYSNISRAFVCVWEREGGGGGEGGERNSLYIVWYRRAAGKAPIFQVICTTIGRDFVSNIYLTKFPTLPVSLSWIFQNQQNAD